MTNYNKNYKFNSGLTYEEAETLAESYVKTFKDDKDLAIKILTSHLARSLRDHEFDRDLISQLLSDRRENVYA